MGIQHGKLSIRATRRTRDRTSSSTDLNTAEVNGYEIPQRNNVYQRLDIVRPVSPPQIDTSDDDLYEAHIYTDISDWTNGQRELLESIDSDYSDIGDIQQPITNHQPSSSNTNTSNVNQTQNLPNDEINWNSTSPPRPRLHAISGRDNFLIVEADVSNASRPFKHREQNFRNRIPQQLEKNASQPFSQKASDDDSCSHHEIPPLPIYESTDNSAETELLKIIDDIVTIDLKTPLKYVYNSAKNSAETQVKTVDDGRNQNAAAETHLKTIVGSDSSYVKTRFLIQEKTNRTSNTYLQVMNDDDYSESETPLKTVYDSINSAEIYPKTKDNGMPTSGSNCYSTENPLKTSTDRGSQNKNINATTLHNNGTNGSQEIEKQNTENALNHHKLPISPLRDVPNGGKLEGKLEGKEPTAQQSCYPALYNCEECHIVRDTGNRCRQEPKGNKGDDRKPVVVQSKSNEGNTAKCNRQESSDTERSILRDKPTRRLRRSSSGIRMFFTILDSNGDDDEKASNRVSIILRKIEMENDENEEEADDSSEKGAEAYSVPVAGDSKTTPMRVRTSRISVYDRNSDDPYLSKIESHLNLNPNPCETNAVPPCCPDNVNHVNNSHNQLADGQCTPVPRERILEDSTTKSRDVSPTYYNTLDMFQFKQGGKHNRTNTSHTLVPKRGLGKPPVPTPRTSSTSESNFQYAQPGQEVQRSRSCLQQDWDSLKPSVIDVECANCQLRAVNNGYEKERPKHCRRERQHDDKKQHGGNCGTRYSDPEHQVQTPLSCPPPRRSTYPQIHRSTDEMHRDRPRPSWQLNGDRLAPNDIEQESADMDARNCSENKAPQQRHLQTADQGEETQYGRRRGRATGGEVRSGPREKLSTGRGGVREEKRRPSLLSLILAECGPEEFTEETVSTIVAQLLLPLLMRRGALFEGGGTGQPITLTVNDNSRREYHITTEQSTKTVVKSKGGVGNDLVVGHKEKKTKNETGSSTENVYDRDPTAEDIEIVVEPESSSRYKQDGVPETESDQSADETDDFESLVDWGRGPEGF